MRKDHQNDLEKECCLVGGESVKFVPSTEGLPVLRLVRDLVANDCEKWLASKCQITINSGLKTECHQKLNIRL
jgi:hypothetical protein